MLKDEEYVQKASFLVGCSYCGELGVAIIEGAPEIHALESEPDSERTLITLVYAGKVTLPAGWTGNIVSGDVRCDRKCDVR